MIKTLYSVPYCQFLLHTRELAEDSFGFFVGDTKVELHIFGRGVRWDMLSEFQETSIPSGESNVKQTR